MPVMTLSEICDSMSLAGHDLLSFFFLYLS
jgi:hypothetical protein